MLVEAAEIEHNLLCSYLYAAFSLRAQGEGIEDEEAAAVKRWRRSILDVAVQEMGHLATVNNLIVSIGGTPHFDRPNFPVPPGYHPPGFELRLTPFDESTLEHFIFLERPEGAPLEDPAPFQKPGKPPRKPPPDALTPSSGDYETIGDFYGNVRDRLRLLAAQRGERAFLRGQPQLGADVVGMKGVVAIEDLASALAALKFIVEQGEGGREGATDSHFARFCAIREEWSALKARRPGFVPAHPAAKDPVMRLPAKGLERVWINDKEAAQVLDLGNALYGIVLLLLAQLYRPMEAAEKKVITGAAIGLMHALSRTGCALARMPASPDRPGVNAGLSFAVPRTSGPRADLSLIVERLCDLEGPYEKRFGGESNPIRDVRVSLEGPSAAPAARLRR